MSAEGAERFDQYRERAEATIADLRARASHYEARLAEQMEAEVSEDDLRDFIVGAVRANDSLPQALRKTYHMTLRYPPTTSPTVATEGNGGEGRG